MIYQRIPLYRIPTAMAETSPCSPTDVKSMLAKANAGPLSCILCRQPMYYDTTNLVYVCLNKTHGVLAYYAVDDCYFTTREEIGIKFAKEGRKFHMLQPEILTAMLGESYA